MNNQRHHIMKVTKRILMILLTLVGISTGAWADGNPDGVFTINSDGDQVIFSKGNLQYQASTNTWRFAENQYDYIGNAVGNTSPSASQKAWLDYFNWGTSGYNHGATCYQPWSTSTSRGNYYAYGSSSKNLYDAKDDGSMRGQADWGYNAISNGGNTENSGWRTLTKEEWAYIITSRTDSYKYAVLKAVNFGEDTDTTAAICGGLAGIYYGYDSIPKEWVNSINRIDEVESLCEEYEEFCDNV